MPGTVLGTSPHVKCLVCPVKTSVRTSKVMSVADVGRGAGDAVEDLGGSGTKGWEPGPGTRLSTGYYVEYWTPGLGKGRRGGNGVRSFQL